MTNAYDSSRGNPTDRQRRKMWLLETYRANVDAVLPYEPDQWKFVGTDVPPIPLQRTLGTGTIACRCYRCGILLTYETLTVDRIIPGCKGGTYRRNNIRPSCSSCATETGNELKKKKLRDPRNHATIDA